MISVAVPLLNEERSLRKVLEEVSAALAERGEPFELVVVDDGAARVLRAGERIHEVAIHYRARSREAGKKLTALDGLRVLRTLVRCRVT